MKLKALFICIFALVLTLGTALMVGAEETDTDEGLPSAYCMRDEYVIFAQNQDDHGLCWNFAATTAQATTLMKATGEYYDFSELWNALVCYEIGLCDVVGEGGYFEYQYEAIQTHGLMLECDLLYQEAYTVSNENADDYFNFHAGQSCEGLASTLTDVSYYRTSVDAIKEHIYNHGALYMTINFKKSFVAGGGAYYLPPNQKNTNSCHAIAVIGWDDDYEMEVYLEGQDTPTTFKGAWIIVNSYTETSGTDGLSYIFYNDKNIGSTFDGVRYEPDTSGDFYFYDKIEEGFAYPTDVVGKYYGDFTAESGVTKQRNIFYDDVALEYSYVVSEGADIEDVRVYLGDLDVTADFAVQIDREARRFSLSCEDAEYGQYKVLVTYGDGERTGRYLNNLFVTHGLVGEEIEYSFTENSLGFNTGRDLEYYSYAVSDKNYVIYTNKLSGTVRFTQRKQSVYTEQYMSIPNISYEITDGVGCRVVHTVTSDSGYELEYVFNFEYCADTTLMPVIVYYDLDGGVNNAKNYGRELASAASDLVLYPPTREGYTFAGWYLDYGNGSRPLETDGELYYISWDDIHHLGESPKMYAVKAYKKYYKNSSTVFVYARWAEEEYHEVRMSVEGNGAAHVAESFTVADGELLKLLMKPDAGWCLSALSLGDTEAGLSELVSILERGLTFTVTEDVEISATFSHGTLLSLKFGENITDAYIQREHNGEVLKFRHGDVVPAEYVSASYNYFDLVVVVRENSDGYTYMPADVSSYTPLGENTFTKRVYITRGSSVKELSLGSAVEKPIQNVIVSYDVGSYVTDHFISADKNATSGKKLADTFHTGETAYLFLKIYEDTAIYEYSLPNIYEYVGDGWYRRTVYVSGATLLGVITPWRDYVYYYVTWENWDGEYISEYEHIYGDVPYFIYEDDDIEGLIESGVPVRPEDELYTYTFAGWSPMLEYVTRDVTYTAQFIAVPKEYTVTVAPTEHGRVTPDEYTVTGLHSYTYAFIPDEGYRIADVTVNGSSVGAVTSYTFTDIRAHQTLEVRFERIKHSVSVTCGEGGTADLVGTTEIGHGDPFSLNITPNERFAISYVRVNGAEIDPAALLSVESVTGDTFIEIGFVQTSFDITLPDGETVSVPRGESYRIDFVAEEGYRVSEVMIDGVSFGALEHYTFVGVDRDHTVSVEYEALKSSVSITLPSGETVSVPIGESYRIDFAAKEGYRVSDVRIDGVSVGAVGHYTFTALDRDHTVEVDYEALKHSVHLVTEGEGSVTADKALDGIAHGESLTLTITHGRLARVLCVLVNGEPVALDGGILFIDTETEMRIEGITADTEITVIFEDLTVLVITAAAAALLLLTTVIAIIAKKRY